MKRFLPLFLTLLPLTCLNACGSSDNAGVRVDITFGTLIGNAEEIGEDPTSHLTWIKKSVLNRLIADKENFLLLLHGSADTCTCYTDWHNKVLAPYIKRNKLLVYAITLQEFESDENYMGLQRISGSDTLAIFNDGKVRYQHTTQDESDPFVTTPSAFASWLGERSTNPSIYYVDSEILDGFYEGNSPFTIYYGRDTCPDCSYLRRTLLKDYLAKNATYDKNLLYFNFDVFRPSRDDEDYSLKMSQYKEAKIKYGLGQSEDNPAGMGEDGVFPTIYYVNPDGEKRTGDVIEAAGVFFNETIDDNGVINDSYYTKERYDSAKNSYLSYLAEANLEHPYFDGMIAPDGETRYERLTPFTKPVFEALLDYSVKA